MGRITSLNWQISFWKLSHICEQSDPAARLERCRDLLKSTGGSSAACLCGNALQWHWLTYSQKLSLLRLPAYDLSLGNSWCSISEWNHCSHCIHSFIFLVIWGTAHLPHQMRNRIHQKEVCSQSKYSTINNTPSRFDAPLKYFLNYRTNNF